MIPYELTTLAVVVIGIGFAAGGLVKGALGAGLPAVGLPIMVMQIEPAQAVALFIVPVMISNVIQVYQGGHYREAVRRFWPFLVTLIIGVWFGAEALTTVDPDIMAVVLGGVVIISTIAQMRAGELRLFEERAAVVHPIAGGALGVCGGATGMFAPTIVYFAALRLPKDLFVTQLALVAMVGSVTMYTRLFTGGFLDWPQLSASALALAPTGLGLIVGIWLRKRMSEAAFRRAVWTALIVLGAGLIAKGLY